ncbi:MAG: putative glycolipid-binding domain-containing protein [Ilumatobacteraceae bacterium]
MERFEAAWELETGHSELVQGAFENEGWTLQCTNTRLDVQYVVRCSPTWQIRQLLLFRDLEEPDLWLATDGGGRWGEMNGAHRTDLDGCSDLSITGSVLSLALPVLRLPLQPGDRAEVHTAEVDTGLLMVLPQHERFHRIEERRWTRESIVSQAMAEWEVDERGLPTDGDGFRRR